MVFLRVRDINLRRMYNRSLRSILDSEFVVNYVPLLLGERHDDSIDLNQSYFAHTIQICARTS